MGGIMANTDNTGGHEFDPLQSRGPRPPLQHEVVAPDSGEQPPPTSVPQLATSSLASPIVSAPAPIAGAPLAPDAAGDPAPALAAPSPARRRPVVTGLAIACGVLLLSTIGLGTALAMQLTEGTQTADPAPTAMPSPDATEDAPSMTVQGLPVVISSDLAFGQFALHAGDSTTVLYATVTNEDRQQAASTFFDISVYDADGRLLERTPSKLYLLPGQTSLLDGYFFNAHPDAAEFRIEQTYFELVAPFVTGDIDLVEIKGADGGYITAQFTSTLSVATEYNDLYLVGFLDGKIYAVCDDYLGFPATGGSFEASCYLDPAWDATEHDVDELHEEAEFGFYYGLSEPIGR